VLGRFCRTLRSPPDKIGGAGKGEGSGHLFGSKLGRLTPVPPACVGPMLQEGERWVAAFGLSGVCLGAVQASDKTRVSAAKPTGPFAPGDTAPAFSFGRPPTSTPFSVSSVPPLFAPSLPGQGVPPPAGSLFGASGGGIFGKAATDTGAAPALGTSGVPAWPTAAGSAFGVPSSFGSGAAVPGSSSAFGSAPAFGKPASEAQAAGSVSGKPPLETAAGFSGTGVTFGSGPAFGKTASEPAVAATVFEKPVSKAAAAPSSSPGQAVEVKAGEEAGKAAPSPFGTAVVGLPALPVAKTGAKAAGLGARAASGALPPGLAAGPGTAATAAANVAPLPVAQDKVR
jgi:hypothetical protein